MWSHSTLVLPVCAWSWLSTIFPTGGPVSPPSGLTHGLHGLIPSSKDAFCVSTSVLPSATASMKLACCATSALSDFARLSTFCRTAPPFMT